MQASSSTTHPCITPSEAEGVLGKKDQLLSLKPEKIPLPLNATVDKIKSTLEIKSWWLYNEWEPCCQFSRYINPHFSNRETLHPKNLKSLDVVTINLIVTTFNGVRGNYALWGKAREKGRWKKVVVEQLPLCWAQKHIKICFPQNESFPVSELNGIVLWKQPSDKKYQLFEGNHRVSSWLALQSPPSLPCVMFIGKPAKKVSGNLCLK